RAAGSPAALYQALHYRTYLRTEEGDFTGALLDLEEAERLGRGHEDPGRVLYPITRSAMLRHLGDAAGARKVNAELRRSAAYLAHDPWVLRELGYAALDEGNVAEARRCAEESLQGYAK